MKLLLIEDEQRLVEALSYLLKKNGYATDTATDGETGVEMALTGVYDVIILDRMLPKLDGISLLQEFRHRGFDTPVLFLTAKDTLKDRVEGLDAGADDYLVKPFSTEELLARLRALARRKNKELINATITVSGMVFDPLRGEVSKENKIIQLSVKESQLLELLMCNQGQVITKERIFEKIWGYYSGTDIANVDLYIHYLRKKLNTTAIKTVRGVGYFFEEN
jgi:two-component system copper resistance phosphate regulon response regulator CusR